MKVDEWLVFFKQHSGKKLFSVSDIVHLVDEPKSSISVQLTRLSHAKILNRVAQGWYANPFNQPSVEEIAMVLRVPSYLSLEYALSRHGILSQRVYTLTLISPHPPYTFQSNQRIYEYHQIQKSLFWGYTNEHGIFIGSPEKAMLDLIYIRGVKTKEFSQKRFSSLLDDMDKDVFDRQLLQSYGKRFSKKTQALAVQLGLLA
ncbi:MAG: hypothetical protein QXX20_04960 [Candidatus Thermoplasmatota archaeon]